MDETRGPTATAEVRRPARLRVGTGPGDPAGRVRTARRGGLRGTQIRRGGGPGTDQQGHALPALVEQGALVAAAVLRNVKAAAGETADTGSLRDDLVALAAPMAESIVGHDGAVLFGLAMAMRSDPEFAREMRSMSWKPRAASPNHRGTGGGPAARSGRTATQTDRGDRTGPGLHA